MARTAVVVAISGLGIAVGLISLNFARGEPGYWFAGSSPLAGGALLAAGWTAIGVGLGSWLRRPESRFGLLLATAGLAWLLPEWNDPASGSALAFTIGLGLYAVCPPLVAHAVLAYPSGRLSAWPQRLTLGVAYVGSVLALGLGPALLVDPAELGCTQCPRNLLAATDHPDTAEDLTRAGVYLGLAWAVGLSALAVHRLVTGPSFARPVLAAGAFYLALVASWFALSADRGLLSNGTGERRVWLGQAVALGAVTLGVVWGWTRARRSRSEVARLVVQLAQSPPPGGLRDVLASIVGDPELTLAYPVGDGGRLVDARGRSVELAPDHVRTTLVRDGRPVAVLAHAPGLLDDEQLVDEVSASARLALENERLQAEVQARLEELRASRARIVEAGDAERRRLERDLHDGAQQRLVGLALSLRLARSRDPQGADPAALARLDEAEAELRLAVAELRDLAHGIFPAVLADEGLAAAVEALAEEGRVPIHVGAMPESRFPAAVETAAYTVVAETVRTAHGGLAVRAARSGDVLVVEVEAHDIDSLALVQLEDRVGAIDGRLIVDRNVNVTIRAELPCAS